MAQSPEQFSESAAGSDYLKSWDALGALIAQGRSFSGRERNSAFLNLGMPSPVPSFACLSGAVNLDQIDDSRAIIPVDWDGDGDLDLWYANRTGPRLRFLRNDLAAGGQWLGLNLEGRTCNRDAVGARAELTLASPDGTQRMLWRRLRAGDSFLSQTPKTLHFGFRAGEKIERLVIRWPTPGPGEEVITGIEPNRRYTVTEGSGAQVLTAIFPPSPATGAAALPDEPEDARIPLVNRLALPKLEYVDFAGKAQSIGGGELSPPVLILLWGSWCPRCRAEMKDLTAQAAALREKGVRVIALAVDAASGSAGDKGIADAKRSLGALRWPFDAGVIPGGSLRALARLESRALYPERQLPLPTSYLLDTAGRIAVIYHGPVAPAQIVKDAVIAMETPNEPETVAFPFPGRSARTLFPLTPAAQARTLREAGYLDDARNELRRQLDRTAKEDSAGKSTIWWQLADLEEEAGRMDEAISACQNALTLTPDLAPLQLSYAATLWKAKRQNEALAAIAKAEALAGNIPAFQSQLGKVWQTLGEHEKARQAFAAALAAAPDDIEALFHLAVSRQFSGDLAGAIADYETIVKRKPDLLDAGSNLAWVLATAKDAGLRQPARALTIAEQINKATGGRSPAVLDNLAAARAATGDFPGAVATAREALTLALAMGESALAADIRKHMAAYPKQQPWIE